jgi:hypothetical protein
MMDEDEEEQYLRLTASSSGEKRVSVFRSCDDFAETKLLSSSDG